MLLQGIKIDKHHDSRNITTGGRYTVNMTYAVYLWIPQCSVS